jgi:hypothetical protein
MNELKETVLSDLVTTSEAAQMTGRDSSVFRHRILAGKLDSVLVGGVLFVRRADIEAYIANGDRWAEVAPAEVGA